MSGKTFKICLRKELLIASRSSDQLLVGLFISLLIALLLGLGVTGAFLTPPELRRLTPALIWVVVFVSAAIYQERNYESEVVEDAIEALCLSKVSLVDVFLAKLFVTFVQLAATTLLAAVCFEGMLNVSILANGFALTTVALPTQLSLASLSIVLSATTAKARLKGVLFPVLMLPLLFPIYFASLELTAGILEPSLKVASAAWYAVLLITTGIYLLGGLLTFPKITRVVKY